MNKSGSELDDGVEPVDTSNKLRTDKKHLMSTVTEPKNQQVEGQSMGCDVNEVQDKVPSNDSYSSYECAKAGNKDWRENKTPVDKENLKTMENKKSVDEGSARSDEEEANNGPSKANAKPKGKKWKLQARNTKVEGVNGIGPIRAKRPSSDGNWPSLE